VLLDVSWPRSGQQPSNHCPLMTTEMPRQSSQVQIRRQPQAVLRPHESYDKIGPAKELSLVDRCIDTFISRSPPTDYGHKVQHILLRLCPARASVANPAPGQGHTNPRDPHSKHLLIGGREPRPRAVRSPGVNLAPRPHVACPPSRSPRNECQATRNRCPGPPPRDSGRIASDWSSAPEVRRRAPVYPRTLVAVPLILPERSALPPPPTSPRLDLSAT